MAYCVSGNYTISGCLGVGIDPAGYRLDVSCTGANSDWLARFQNSNGTEKIGTYISHGSGYGMAIDSTQNNSNYILKLMAGTGGGTGQGSVPVFYAQHDGKIGIGTSSPATRLQIKGTNTYHQISACFFGTYNAGFSFSDDLAGITYDAGTNSLCLYSDYTGYGKVVISTCGAPRLTATVNGNIGIGTTTPDSKIHICNAVNGGTNNYSLIIQNACTVADARAGIAFSNNAQTPSAGGLSGASIQTSNNGIDGTGNLLFGTLLSGTNTERMRISHNGNIGISCTSPGSKLTVGGTLTTTDTITTTSGTVNTIISWNSVVGIVGTDTNHGLQIRTCGTERIRITCNGEIGINTSSPGSYKLYVNGSFYSAGSSCEYKQSICQYNTDSCMFMKLKPVTYQYKDEWCHLGKELKSGTQIGLIAEDTAEVFPELAILKDEEEQKVVRNVDYEKLSIILLSEVQKLRKEVDNLKNNK